MRFAAQVPMHISYVYEGPVPSRYAAFIQILNTSRALCARGVSVTVYADRIAADEEDALAFYGVEPHPALRLQALPRTGVHRLTRPFRLHKMLCDAGAHDRHIIMTRGEAGVRLYRTLRRLPWPPNVRFVYEAHRPCFSMIPARQATGGLLTRGRVAWATARMRAAERRVVEGADGLVCLTHGVRTALADTFAPTAPTLVLPSGTTLPEGPVPDDTERDLDLFYAGKLSERKGVYDLMRALRHLPDAHCWIAGGPDAAVDALRALAESEGVADRVTLLGLVPPAEVPALYDRARVGVCPLPVGVSAISERYTSPLKVLNMMAHGVPVVATDLPSVRELLVPDRTALLVPPSDPPALAAAVRRLLADRPLATILTAAARAEAWQYTWPERARRLHDFLQSLP